MKLLIAAALSLCAWAQSGLERPCLGFMLDANGEARPVCGIAGSVTTGEPVLNGVLSIGCSRKMCLAKTETSILSSSGAPDGAIDAPHGPALFALDEDHAFVFFPASGQLARVQDGKLAYLDFTLDGEVLSLRARDGSLEFAVRRDGGVWIVRDGGVTGTLPEATGPVMLLKDGVLFASADALVLRRPDGSETRFAVVGLETLYALGEGYAQARAGNESYAVRLEPGHEQIFLLPETPP